MVYRYYDVCCDYCKRIITTIPDKKPNYDVLLKHCYAVTRTKQFCSDECFANWNHDRQAKQYWNLKQRGRIHNRE